MPDTSCLARLQVAGNWQVVSEPTSPSSVCIIIETGDVDDAFERVRGIIQSHNGKMVEALWLEKKVKLIFSLGREQEGPFFDELNKLGTARIEKEGYRNKNGNIVVFLKER